MVIGVQLLLYNYCTVSVTVTRELDTFKVKMSLLELTCTVSV